MSVAFLTCAMITIVTLFYVFYLPGRLRLGPENTRLTTGRPGTVAVPVRLADPAVADLLTAGTRVDVIAAATPDASDTVLASDATVVTVLPGTPALEKLRDWRAPVVVTV